MSKYKCTENKQITTHFNALEFRCKCGQNHDTEINTALCEKLETLFESLNCSKIIITSGFRCPSHSVKVGGYASDEHTKGNAADIICYDKSGKVIDTRLVCCAAQDLQFSGIGRIDNSAVHVDVSLNRKWYGDEMTGYVSQSIPDMDFYSYFGMQKKTKKQVKITVEFDDHKYSGLLDEMG